MREQNGNWQLYTQFFPVTKIFPIILIKPLIVPSLALIGPWGYFIRDKESLSLMIRDKLIIRDEEINPQYSLEGLMLQYLELKLQKLQPPNAKSQLIGKDPFAGKVEGRRRRGRQRVRWMDGIIISTDLSVSTLWEIVKDREAWCAAVHAVTKNQTQFSN